MSLYQLHRCVWDELRAEQRRAGTGPTFDPRRYDLTDDERRAYESVDIARLYGLGLHPILLEAYARRRGHTRRAHREALQVFAVPERRRARWQT
jgi:hypothetical protein